MEKALFCPHHVIDRTPADDSKVSMQNDDKKRKREEPRKSTKNKRRRLHTIEEDQQPLCRNANVDGVDGQQTSINDDQRPTSSIANVNGAEDQPHSSINANIDGGDGHQNGILDDDVETAFKDYLLKSANCSQLTNFLSHVILNWIKILSFNINNFINFFSII